MELPKKYMELLLIFLSQLIWFILKTQALSQNVTWSLVHNKTASAIFVFGDSTADPGNNNYIPTIFRSNFAPYGRDFYRKKPTGRFTNGRLTTDFIASYVGLKDYVPPYLDHSLSTEELLTGVSFASAGSGYDPLTSQFGNVIPVSKQLEYFKEYKKRMESKMGKKETEEHIKKAIFVISAGTNDFVVNYFSVPIRRNTFTISTYQLFVIQLLKHFVQDLWAEGARRMLVSGLPPMGCLPLVITLNWANSKAQRSCLTKYSSVAIDYNQILQNELKSMQFALANFGARISYIDIYTPILDLIHGHSNFGIEEIYNGCCGTGYLEVSFLCNPLSYTCPDASKYLFWDSIHPTQTTYFYVFKTICPIIDKLLEA